MENQTALQQIFDFKGNSLTDKLAQIKDNTIGKTKDQIPVQVDLFKSALTVKKASAQINEIVHAIGILNSLSQILDQDEKVQELSLAAGAAGEGFDLVTNKRIAEFKFSRWQSGVSKNGMRKRHIFADFANLTVTKSDKKKELYAVSADQIRQYFDGRANWEKVLSKSGKIQHELKNHLIAINQSEIKTLKEVFEISTVQIFDLDDILNMTK